MRRAGERKTLFIILHYFEGCPAVANVTSERFWKGRGEDSLGLYAAHWQSIFWSLGIDLITVDRRSSSAGDLGEADNHDHQHADTVSAREMKDYTYLPTCSGRVRQRLLFLR